MARFGRFFRFYTQHDSGHGADPCFTDADTQIFGNNSVLDSLGLVNLVTMFEESIAEKFAIEIDILERLALDSRDALTISDLLIETAAMLAEELH